MRTSIIALLKHIAIFIIIEIIFVVVLFREFPEINLLSAIGILHTSYRGILALAGRLRQISNSVWQKFLCSYVPIIYHAFIHVYIGWATIEAHNHDDHDLLRIIMGTLLLGVLIASGERYLHRALHCQTHHTDAHAHCNDDCEDKHSNNK